MARRSATDMDRKRKQAAKLYVQMETGTYDWEGLGLKQPFNADGSYRVIQTRILQDLGYKNSPNEHKALFQHPVFLAYRNLARKRFRMECLAKEAPKDNMREELLDWVERELLVRALENPDDFTVTNLLQLHKYLAPKQPDTPAPESKEEPKKEEFPDDWEGFLKQIREEVPQEQREEAMALSEEEGYYDQASDDDGEAD